MPDFRGMVSDLKHGTFPHSSNWVPIPVEYLEPQARGGSGGSGGSRAPSAVPTGGSSVSSGRTGVSSLTADPPRAPLLPIENPTSDAEFRSITVRPGGTRPILSAHPPPSNDAGTEFCVSWWLRGSCYPNCRRRAAHVPFASPGERTRLLTFCRERLAVQAAAGGATA